MRDFPSPDYSLDAALKRLRDTPGLRFYADPLLLDLNVARIDTEFQIPGDTFLVAQITGSLACRFNEKDNPEINLQLVRRLFTPFERFYLTNTAQIGKSATIYIGRDALFISESAVAGGAMKLLTTGGVEIDPATETTLATQLNITLSALRDAVCAAAPNAKSLNSLHTELLKMPNRAVTPVLYNVAMANADTEYSQELPANTKRFKVVLADGAIFRLAFVTGKVAAPVAPFWTQPAGLPYEEVFIQPTALTLFFASPAITKVAQIVAWS